MKIIVNNCAIEYQDTGEGPVVLFLHGWKDNLHTFDLLMPALSTKYRIIRLDLPGFGSSDIPSDSWNVSSYVSFVTDFIKKLHIEPTYIVGHSLGCRVIIKGVSEGALSPQKIVLIGAAGIAQLQSSKRIALNIIAKIGKLATSIPPFSHFRESLRKRLYNKIGSDYFGAGSLKQTYLNVTREDLASYAARIDIPTLLIWGSEDTQTPLDDGIRFSKIIKNSKLVVLDGKSHFVHREDPQKIAQLIKEFFI